MAFPHGIKVGDLVRLREVPHYYYGSDPKGVMRRAQGKLRRVTGVTPRGAIIVQVTYNRKFNFAINEVQAVKIHAPQHPTTEAKLVRNPELSDDIHAGAPETATHWAGGCSHPYLREQLGVYAYFIGDGWQTYGDQQGTGARHIRNATPLYVTPEVATSINAVTKTESYKSSAKRNSKLTSAILKAAPAGATHYVEDAIYKFHRVLFNGEVQYHDPVGWASYTFEGNGERAMAEAVPLYIDEPTKPDVKELQSRDELIAENISLENQIVSLRNRLSSKRAFVEANLRKIEAWDVLLK